MNNTSVRQDESLESLVAQVVDEFREAQQGGAQPDIEEYAARYPHAADLLRKVLASWRLIGQSAGGGKANVAGETVSGVLGDYRLLREVGRGGMGVVYEAEQISLGRRVALKVLPFAATMDPRHLQRFHNEARAAASLHHEHIVPVYGVGQERGVHYYAMQFIDGQTLAAFLEQQAGGSPQSVQPTTAHETPTPPSPAADTATQAAASTVHAPRDGAYFRRLAEWGIHAALALEHAHQLGVVHRDIKPANLMLDEQGKLWVTDFGLARTAADAGLTMTGDLVGTLRYMSPEQALAKRIVIDHRTDIYSLGVTLYELSTGQPAVSGSSREEILRQIVFSEPKRPRQLNRAIPLDLETITLKAMAQEPERRYATAQELADDLQRFLEVRPILARRPSLVERARKWTRRHRTVTMSGVVVVLVTLIALASSTVLIALAWEEALHQRDSAKTEWQRAEDEAQRAAENAARATENAAKATAERKRAESNLQNALRLAERFSTTSGGPFREATVEHLNFLTQLSREAGPVWDAVTADYPGVPKYAQRRFSSYHVLSQLLVKDGQFQEAAKAQRRAVECVEKWAADFPDDRMVRPFQRVLRAAYYVKLGDVLRATGECADAERAYGRALALFEELRLERSKAGGRGLGQILKILPAIHNSLGGLRLEDGRLDESRQAYAQALALLQGPLPADLQADISWPAIQAGELCRSHHGLAEVFLASGATKDATAEFRETLRWHERQVAMRAPVFVANSEQATAWFLVACPIQELNDPKRAMELAKHNVETQSRGGWSEVSRCYHTLAVAQYRAGDWKAARETLMGWPGVQHSDGPVAFVWAMTLWRLDKKKEARGVYDGTVQWMDKNKPRDVELRRFRAEAAALLKIEDQREQK